MRRFTTLLVVSPLPDGTSWVLREPLVYWPNGHAIEVPPGFCTDFASVPRALWWLLPKWGRHGNAAVLHDFLYWSQPCSRSKADRTLREACEILGVLFVVRWSMWFAVRTFGWIAWWVNAMNRKHGHERVISFLPSATDRVPPRGLDRLVRVFFGRRAA